jgi:5'(3')-deoxyribonucleotidase
MDGVLANLYDYMTLRIFKKEFKHLDQNQINVFRTVFRTKLYFDHYFPEGPEKVFENLEPFPFNKTLIETVKKANGEYSILSRPFSMDLEGTKRAKKNWIKKHLSFCPPKDVLLVQDKSANGRAKGNVLIDDWDSFLERWKEKGGHPIKFRAIDFETSEQVQNYIESSLKLGT